MQAVQEQASPQARHSREDVVGNIIPDIGPLLGKVKTAKLQNATAGLLQRPAPPARSPGLRTSSPSTPVRSGTGPQSGIRTTFLKEVLHYDGRLLGTVSGFAALPVWL